MNLLPPEEDHVRGWGGLAPATFLFPSAFRRPSPVTAQANCDSPVSTPALLCCSTFSPGGPRKPTSFNSPLFSPLGSPSNNLSSNPLTILFPSMPLLLMELRGEVVRERRWEKEEGTGGIGCQDPRPELEVCLLQIVVQDPQVLALPGEGLAGCSMLQELSHSPQGVALGGGQGAACCHGHNVEGVGGHYSRVQEAVVQEVPYDLRAQDRRSTWGPPPQPQPRSPSSPGWKDHLRQPRYGTEE